MSGRAARASKARKRERAAARRRQIMQVKADFLIAWMDATGHALRGISRIAAGLAERHPESARRWGGKNVFFDVTTERTHDPQR